MLANVIWPFHGALFAQWIPVFLFMEACVVHVYFRDAPKGKVVLAVLSANFISTLGGAILVSPLAANWDSLVTKASNEINACVVAFVLTVPIELLVLGWFPSLKPASRRFRASLMMNLATYSICLAVVIYHWRWGYNAD